MEEHLRARVFISCGQQEEELHIAKQIAEILQRMDFEPYIAVMEQTLKGLKENIYRRLEESEYFLFVDFKRENIAKGERRGSLFSHQELAIATMLDIDVLAFQEDGVKKDDGILKYIQANCISFAGRHLLPDLVFANVNKRGWNQRFRRELIVGRADTDYADARYADSPRQSRYYHVNVENRHLTKTARDCLVFLQSVKNIASGKTEVIELREIKWKGMTIASISIPPQSSRSFDAFYVFHDAPHVAILGFNMFIIDYTGYLAQLTGPGEFELCFIVYSDKFAPAKVLFKLTLGSTLEQVNLSKMFP